MLTSIKKSVLYFFCITRENNCLSSVFCSTLLVLDMGTYIKHLGTLQHLRWSSSGQKSTAGSYYFCQKEFHLTRGRVPILPLKSINKLRQAVSPFFSVWVSLIVSYSIMLWLVMIWKLILKLLYWLISLWKKFIYKLVLSWLGEFY